MNNKLKLIGRYLLVLMFVVSVYKSITGNFNSGVNLIKSKNLPLPFLLAVIGLAIKAFGSYALISGNNLDVALPLLIIFMLSVIVLFNNPFVDSSKLWMCIALLGMVGGMLILYSEEVQ